MKEAPELNIESRDVAVEPEKQREDTIAGKSGGIPQHEVDQNRLEDAKRAAELADKLKTMPETLAQTVEAKKPLDISFLRNKIKDLEAGAQKQNWFKRQFGNSDETLKRLKVGLYKIEDPKFKGSFAKAFEEAYEQGGEKFALEYAEAIGNGELVKPENGVLMMNDKRSADNLFNQ